MNFIPPFMRNKYYAVMLVGGLGGITWTIYKQKIETKISHPLVRESVLLLQNNDEVVQSIGVPLVVVPKFGTRAAIADDRANFSYVVRGPRGTMNIEVAGMSVPLKDLGVNHKGKTIIKEEIEKAKAAGQDVQVVATNTKNLDEYNFNDFYIPDSSIVSDYLNLSSPLKPEEETIPIGGDKRFWKYEYLMADAGGDLRILVAPNEQQAKSEPVYDRKTLADLKREYHNRLHNYRVMDANMTQEEKEEFRKFRYQEHFRKIGYIRTYLLIAVTFFSVNAYVLFRHYKRVPIINSSLQENLKKFLLTDARFRKLVPGYSNIYWTEYSLGSKIADQAKYSFNFMTHDNYGTVLFDGLYDQKNAFWTVKEVLVEVKDKNGEKVGETLRISSGPKL